MSIVFDREKMLPRGELTIRDDIKLIEGYSQRRSRMSGSSTSKKGFGCPRCHRNLYAFDGKWKRCAACMLDNFWEHQVLILKDQIKKNLYRRKTYLKHGIDVGNIKKRIFQAAEYIRAHNKACSAITGGSNEQR